MLHRAARSGNPECIRFIFALYPKSYHEHALYVKDQRGRTVLRCVMPLEYECIKAVLALYPASERRRALNMKDKPGSRTSVFQNMDKETRDSIMKWLSSSSGQK